MRKMQLPLSVVDIEGYYSVCDSTQEAVKRTRSSALLAENETLLHLDDNTNAEVAEHLLNNNLEQTYTAELDREVKDAVQAVDAKSKNGPLQVCRPVQDDKLQKYEKQI